jgi:hypothetical protein
MFLRGGSSAAAAADEAVVQSLAFIVARIDVGLSGEAKSTSSRTRSSVDLTMQQERRT